MHKQKATNDELLLEYKKTKNIWKVAKKFGMCGQSVHERLKRLKAIKNNYFSEEEKEKIRALYKEGFKVGDKKLDNIAKELNRQKTSICRFAKKEGLTNLKRKYTDELKNEIGKRASLFIKQNGKPKGMLGKKHSKETLSIISLKSKNFWKNMSAKERKELINKQMMFKIKKYGSLALGKRVMCSWKCGWRTIGGKRKFFRSRWEANYARYLEYLKKKREIKDWNYETKLFLFNGEDKGVRAYLPDFEIKTFNGNIEYHEVKGWYDNKSKQKIQRMKKHYPSVILKLIREKEYKNIGKKYSNLLEGWE